MRVQKVLRPSDDWLSTAIMRFPVAWYKDYSVSFMQQATHSATNVNISRCIVCLMAQHPTLPVCLQAASQLLYSTVWQVSSAHDLAPAPTSAAAGVLHLRLRLCPQREAAGPCQPAFAAAAEVLQRLQTRAAAAQQGGRPVRLTVYDASIAQNSAARVRHLVRRSQKVAPRWSTAQLPYARSAA